MFFSISAPVLILGQHVIKRHYFHVKTQFRIIFVREFRLVLLLLKYSIMCMYFIYVPQCSQLNYENTYLIQMSTNKMVYTVYRKNQIYKFFEIKIRNHIFKCYFSVSTSLVSKVRTLLSFPVRNILLKVIKFWTYCTKKRQNLIPKMYAVFDGNA